MLRKSYRDSELSDKDSDSLWNIFLEESITDLRSSPWLKPSNILSLLSLITTLILGAANLRLGEVNSELNKRIEDLQAQVFATTERVNRIIEELRQASVSNPDPEHVPTPTEIAEQTTASTSVAENLISGSASFTPELNGVKIVYIQYQDDVAKARQLRQYLISQGITTPQLEQVDDISSSSIRYSGSVDEAQAIQLREFLEQEPELNLEFDGGIINLSDRGYNAPDGQFEVWLRY